MFNNPLLKKGNLFNISMKHGLKYFCSSNLTLSNIQTLKSDLSFEIVLPSLQRSNFEIFKTSTYKDLENEIKKENKHITVEFKTWDNSIISKSNSITQTLSGEDPIFLKINNMEWQILNSKNFEFTHTENYKIKEDLIQDARFELKEVTDKVYNLNRNFELSKNEINRLSFQIFKIKNFYKNLNYSNDIKSYKNLEELFENYYDLKSEYAKLHTLKEKLIKKCELKAKILILLAGLLFVLELFLFYYGTFIVYAWDITEPITYLVTCCNIIFALYFKKKMGNMSTFEYHTNKYFKRLVKAKKFDEIKLKEVKMQLQKVEHFLNK